MIFFFVCLSLTPQTVRVYGDGTWQYLSADFYNTRESHTRARTYVEQINL